MYIPDVSLERHCCIFGSTGSGKSRLALHFIEEELRKGHSVVALDPKYDTIASIEGIAWRCGIPTDRVTVMEPSDSRFVPGWNPLATMSNRALSVSVFVSILSEAYKQSWGARMDDILKNALLLLAYHDQTLYELPAFLTTSGFRQAVLKMPLVCRHDEPYDQARQFFSYEFDRWPERTQADVVAPILNKVRELLRSPFFNSLFCTRENSVRLEALWQEQRVLLVHLDQVNLGPDGARLLGGLFAHATYQTAMSHRGAQNPVLLVVDEMGVQERFIGRALTDILAVARSQSLRLLVASQHLDQLSGDMRHALLANCAVQAYFRLGHADSQIVASHLASLSSQPRLPVPPPPPAPPPPAPPPPPPPKRVERQIEDGKELKQHLVFRPNKEDRFAVSQKKADLLTKLSSCDPKELARRIEEMGAAPAYVKDGDKIQEWREFINDLPGNARMRVRQEGTVKMKAHPLAQAVVGVICIGGGLIVPSGLFLKIVGSALPESPANTFAQLIGFAGAIAGLLLAANLTEKLPRQFFRQLSIEIERPRFKTVIEEIPVPAPHYEAPRPVPPKPEPDPHSSLRYMSAAERKRYWEEELLAMEDRTCALLVAGHRPEVVDVPTVEKVVAPGSWVEESRAATGFSEGARIAQREERKHRIEQLSSVTTPPPPAPVSRPAAPRLTAPPAPRYEAPRPAPKQVEPEPLEVSPPPPPPAPPPKPEPKPVKKSQPGKLPDWFNE